MTFLDAYMGDLLTSGLTGSAAVGDATKTLVLVETVVIVVVSVLVTNFATGLFAEMMSDEGWDVAAVTGAPDDAPAQGGTGDGGAEPDDSEGGSVGRSGTSRVLPVTRDRGD